MGAQDEEADLMLTTKEVETRVPADAVACT